MKNKSAVSDSPRSLIGGSDGGDVFDDDMPSESRAKARAQGQFEKSSWELEELLFGM